MCREGALPRNDDTVRPLLSWFARSRGGEVFVDQAVLPQVRPHPGTCPMRGFEYCGWLEGKFKFLFAWFYVAEPELRRLYDDIDKRWPVS